MDSSELGPTKATFNRRSLLTHTVTEKFTLHLCEGGIEYVGEKSAWKLPYSSISRVHSFHTRHQSVILLETREGEQRQIWNIAPSPAEAQAIIVERISPPLSHCQDPASRKHFAAERNSGFMSNLFKVPNRLSAHGDQIECFGGKSRVWTTKTDDVLKIGLIEETLLDGFDITNIQDVVRMVDGKGLTKGKVAFFLKDGSHHQIIWPMKEAESIAQNLKEWFAGN